MNVRDTQTGLKLIRRDVLAAVLPRMLEKRYAFDLEFLVVARSLGFARVFEAPVRIDYRFASHVNPGPRCGSSATRSRSSTATTSSTPTEAAACPGARGAAVSLARRADGADRAPAICFINWRDVENPEAGGAEVVTHEVAKRWAAHGYDVTQLASSFRAGASPPRGSTASTSGGSAAPAGSFHLRVQRELARLRGFDVVVESVNTIPFLTPLWRSRLPTTVPLFHQLAADVWDAELPRPLARVGPWLEPGSCGSTATPRSSPCRRRPATTSWSSGFKSVAVVANGRDEPPACLALDPKEPSPTFLFVGRLAANKRPQHALEAFRAIRRAIPTRGCG